MSKRAADTFSQEYPPAVQARLSDSERTRAGGTVAGACLLTPQPAGLITRRRADSPHQALS